MPGPAGVVPTLPNLSLQEIADVLNSQGHTYPPESASGGFTGISDGSVGSGRPGMVPRAATTSHGQPRRGATRDPL